MMRIDQVDGKWTVVAADGQIMLRKPTGRYCGSIPITDPLLCETREEVKNICLDQGLYEVGPHNPDDIPEGTLVELRIGQLEAS